jgi:KaiC/GvpD/RAD55 family RecA-like ATPase
MPKLSNPDYVEKEKQIAIGCIVSDDFLAEYSRVHRPELFRANGINRVIHWCLQHWNKFQEAPKTAILQIWEDAQNKGEVFKGEADILEQVLENLNRQYLSAEADFHPEFEFQRALEYLRSSQLEDTINAANELRKAGKYDEAEKLFLDMESIGAVSLEKEFAKSAIECQKFVSENIAVPKRLLDPWLNANSLNMIFAAPGAGKTWLAMAIAVGLTRKNWDETEIGLWTVNNPAGVLYIDGEMGEHAIQERFQGLLKAYGEEANIRAPLVLFSANRHAKISRKQIDLTHQSWRDSIYEYIAKRPRIKVIIIDNLSSLTPGRDENDKKEWDPINQWLLSLRHLGLAVIVIHHAGKNRKQRGTSGHSDPMDTVIHLQQKKKAEEGVNISFEKARNLAPGKVALSFGLRLESNNGGVKWKFIPDPPPSGE